MRQNKFLKKEKEKYHPGMKILTGALWHHRELLQM